MGFFIFKRKEADWLLFFFFCVEVSSLEIGDSNFDPCAMTK
jgi:hypothetical protein